MFKSKAPVATVATALALLAGAGSAAAHVDGGGVVQGTGTSSIPAGMTAQQWHALVVRGEGYNRLYGLGKYATPQLRKLHGVPARAITGTEIRNALGAIGGWSVPQTRISNSPYGIPQGMTAENLASPATRAALLRGEALNARYGNAWTKLSAQEYATIVNLFGSGVTSYSPKQLRTLLARAESVGTTPSVATSGSDGFSWGDAGIGGLGAIGIALACAVAAFFHHRGRGPESSLGEAHGTV